MSTPAERKHAEAAADFAERVICAVVVAAITYVIARHFFDSDPHSAGEPAILNAGLAYYTHQATGGLAGILSSIAGGITYHCFKRWQKNKRDEKNS